MKLDDIENIDDDVKEDELSEEQSGDSSTSIETLKQTILSGMYQDWFLDYASYVILERAVPHLNDGLKPVQRRILHSMKRLDDGRYNKVANIIGHTMQFHPHGDASIGDALVQLGQKDLLIDAQGNWGNILTGDNAAAARYIEARLSKFALEVVFNPKTTLWKPSYDGRNQEPITLPVKFPLLLAQGVEGIAVGLASKILPHNFIELIDASIKYLKRKPFELYPDFQTGGLADCSKYNDGIRGGAIKLRARIKQLDKKTLAITEIPFGRTTSSLIDSILKANDKGKIKIRKIDDNTAENVEILIHLVPGISPDKTIDALYAFTDCEVSISPNCCVVDDDKPKFIGITELLKISADNTVKLLTSELEIKKEELQEILYFSSLEKIFIEERIYHKIENCETWESVLQTIRKGLEPFKLKLLRPITEEDIIQLTEIKIKRISKFDTKKADQYIKDTKNQIQEVKNNLAHIIDYTITFYEHIKSKFGSGRERKTELRSFETISAIDVVVASEKLYVNRLEGFIGTGLKKDEYISYCSDIDEIIVIRKDGTYLITKISEKSFVGKDILHVAVFKKNDERTIYNLVYLDGATGVTYIKRCPISGLTRDKEYTLTQGTTYSRLLYFTVNPNGEAETIKIYLKPRPKLKNLILEMNFAEQTIKGRASMGNIVTRYPIHKIVLLEKGVSTLGGTKIWWDPEVLRLNTDERGEYLGEFNDDEKILVITKSGLYRFCDYDLSNHFEDELMIIEKLNPSKIASVVYYDIDQKTYYLKRFIFEPTDKLTNFMDENPSSKFILLSFQKYPQFLITFGGKYKNNKPEKIDVHEFIPIKGLKTKGRKLTSFIVKNITEIEPLVKKEPAGVPGSDKQNVIPKQTEEKIFKDTSSKSKQMTLGFE